MRAWGGCIQHNLADMWVRTIDDLGAKTTDLLCVLNGATDFFTNKASIAPDPGLPPRGAAAPAGLITCTPSPSHPGLGWLSISSLFFLWLCLNSGDYFHPCLYFARDFWFPSRRYSPPDTRKKLIFVETLSFRRSRGRLLRARGCCRLQQVAERN